MAAAVRFSTQMIIYTMIQELATGVNYTNLRRRAESEGDEALARTLRWVSADESAHYNFFRKGVKTYLALERKRRSTISNLSLSTSQCQHMR
jgi:acyl-[acyl-carrier-protein] desaturase